MAEPVTLLTDDDLDRAMCDARADGDLLTQDADGDLLTQELIKTLRELRRPREMVEWALGLRRDPRLLPVIENPNPDLPRKLMPVTLDDERLMVDGHWSLLLGHGICPWPSCGGYVGDVELFQARRGSVAAPGFCPHCAGAVLAVLRPQEPAP